MTNRWSALALLFCVRTVMAFQFQTVAALSPFIETEYGVGLGAIGLIFGLYMAPGVFLAIPGSGLARRFGEKRIVITGLWLMALGLGIMAVVPGWNAALAGRLIAGTGGILMNLIMTKMVADWFDGKEIATAMSFFIVSWPAGVALALISLPPVADMAGLGPAMGVGCGLAVCAALAFVAYKPAPGATVAKPGAKTSRPVVLAALATGGAWGFLNAALAIVFGFGVALLVARSVDVQVAGQVTSLTMIALAVIGPLGGYIADRTGRYMTLIGASVLIMALALVLIVSGLSSIWLFVLFGLACGLAAGPVMSLPGIYIPANERSGGMGVFFLVYYASVLMAPPMAGWAAEMAERTEAAFVVGIFFCILTLGALAATRWVARANAR